MKNKGITLVALVVTVIILLIIAGVAVSMITGNDGLFTKANEAGSLYNESAENEFNIIQQLINSEFFDDSTDEEINEEPDDGNNKITVNVPDTSKLPVNTTKYVTYTESNGTYTEQLNSSMPDEWYDYEKGKWANIKTTNTDGTLEATWVWIPRFAYRLPEKSRNNEKVIDVVFLKNDTKKGILDNGKTVEAYYSTDAVITTGGTGYYSDATELAKGTKAGEEQAWIVHPAFWLDKNNNGNMDSGEQLTGIWVAKFEASSNTPSATNGGGNSASLKVQIKPDVTSWRGINIKTAFEVTRAMQDNGGALGTDNNINIDTHMAKNIEWGAISILTHSKYGIYNEESAVALENKSRVWNNPNSSYITGTVAKATYTGSNDSSTRDALNIAKASCVSYNTGNGPKGSSTGTVYGIYDIAGGAWEHVMGIMATDNTLTNPMVKNTGYTASTWASNVEKKYYNIYKIGNWNAYNGRGYIGDMTEELLPTSDSSRGYIWFGDHAYFVESTYPSFLRGGYYNGGSAAGDMAFARNTGEAREYDSFRPILICFQ